MDGCLLNTRGRLHKITRAAVQDAANKGVEVVFYTSRSYQHALKIGKNFTFKPHIISNQGGFIAEALTRPIFVKRISESTTIDIVRLLESMDCHVRIIHDEQTYANSIRFPNRMNSKIRWAANDYTFYTQQYVESLVEHLLVVPIAPQQIDVYFENIEDRTDAIAALKAIFENIDMQIDEDGKVTILPEGVNVKNGLNYLCEHLGIDIAEAVVFGCDETDAEIVELAGIGIATANASMAVKNVADWITRSNNEFGTAYAVREVFRKQQAIDFLKRYDALK
ncbi:MAG: hydrolase family protein [Bacillales bacterium]|nr:hydrolase family protein [Bacillales bacterium]